MGQAAARGLLPGPATVDLREVGTWLWLRAIAKGIRDEHNVAALRLQHARALTMFDPTLDQSQRQQLEKLLNKIEDSIDRILTPWAGREARSTDVASMELQWEKAWGGKMSDPAMQARIAEDCRKLIPRKRLPTRKG